jgi:putative hemolysin
MFFVYIALLVVFSAWFSGMEIALFSITAANVKSLVVANKKNARLLQKVLQTKKRLLVVLLLGSNLLNVTIASATSLWVNARFSNDALAIATGITTLLILIFVEITPKAFFQARAEKMTLLFIPLVYFLEIVLFPIAFLLEKLLLLIIGDKKMELVSEQEFRALSRMAVEKGVIDFKEHEMIMNVLEFDDVTAREVMTPRYKMLSLSDDIEVDRIAHFMAKEGFSRYPVYHGKEDNIVGYVHLIDVMRVLNSDNREDVLAKHVNPVIKVDEGEKIHKIFRRMIKECVHIALVYRKKEQLMGMLSLEDILEELVGEIRDESDEEVVEDEVKC